MKITKRILSVILSMVMILSLSLSVFAANNGVGKGGAATAGTAEDPHVGGADFGDTDDDGSITLYKLNISAFEAAKSEELGYEVIYEGNRATGGELGAGDEVGFIYAAGDASKTPIETVTLGDLDALSNITFRIESVNLNSGATPGSIIAGDYTADGNIDSYALTEGGYIYWTGLADGYYKVTEIDNSTATPVGNSSYIISLPMVDPDDESGETTTNDVYVYPKNRAKDGPEIIKDKPTIDDVNGNIVNWKITSDVPATIKGEVGKQSYVITDTMGSGLALIEDSLEVYYNDSSTGTTEKVVLTADDGVDDNDYSVAYNATTGKLVVTLNADGFAKLATAIADGEIDTAPDGYKLYVEYKTVVSLSDEEWEELFDERDPVTNKVHLDFTNDDGTDYDDDGEPVEVDDLASIKIIKYDGATDEPEDVDELGTTYLPGAKFKVYTKLMTENGKQVVDPTSVLKDAVGNDIELTTRANGAVSYNGLGAGTYYLVETAAPTNYVGLSGYVEVEITKQNCEDNDTLIAVIANYLDNGLTLPQTGGMGTFLFIAIGVALMCSAGFVLIISKRRGIVK